MSDQKRKMLVKYVKNSKGQRVGVVVAIDRDKVGWSKCNFSMGDKFNRDRGKFIAIKRAEKYNYTPTIVQKVPHSTSEHIIIGGNCITIEEEQDFCDVHNIAQCIRPDLLYMVERSRQYFKDTV